MITSTSNNKIKNVIQLSKSSKARREHGSFIVEGVKMFMEAPSMHIKEVYVSESFLKKAEESCLKKLKETGYEEVSDAVFKTDYDRYSFC